MNLHELVQAAHDKFDSLKAAFESHPALEPRVAALEAKVAELEKLVGTPVAFSAGGPGPDEPPPKP
jgi:uncharacterized protein YceH (UPF0502 family)